MDFTVTITDQAELDAITWAREQHNRELESTTVEPLADDAAYVQYVMGSAAKSYVVQKRSADVLAAAAPPPPAEEPVP